MFVHCIFIMGPIQYEQRLLPVVLDEIAATSPGCVFAAIPKTADANEVFRDVLFSEVANALKRTTMWLHRNFANTPARDFVASRMGVGYSLRVRLSCLLISA